MLGGGRDLRVHGVHLLLETRFLLGSQRMISVHVDHELLFIGRLLTMLRGFIFPGGWLCLGLIRRNGCDWRDGLNRRHLFYG